MASWTNIDSLQKGVSKLQLLFFITYWELKNVKAIGTDGEVNIIDAAHQQFPDAILLRRFRHLQTNIERHLHGKHLPVSTIKLFVQDNLVGLMQMVSEKRVLLILIVNQHFISLWQS